MSLRDQWTRDTIDLERELEERADWQTTALKLARNMLATSDSPMQIGSLEQIIAVLSIVHLGENDERCQCLCGEPPRWDGSNIDLRSVTWTDDGSWIDVVTCPECLRLAVKIGDDAKARIAALAR